MVAGVVKPHVIIGALNVSGTWDPTLYIALTTASGTYALIRLAVRRRSAPLAAETFHEPTNRPIDGKLVLGAALFGALLYLLAMVVGIGVAEPAYQWLRGAGRCNSSERRAEAAPMIR